MSLQCQKIKIKKLPFYASDITNFTSAVCAVVLEMSSVWGGEPIFESWANSYSADLYSSYTTVLNFSSSWVNTDDPNVNSFVYSNSANILQVDSIVNSSSANWNAVYNSYNSASGSFLTYSSADVRYVKLSGDVMTGGLSSPSLSTNNLYVAGSTINFFNESGNVIETLKSNDVENFKSNYTLTNSSSANWEEVYTQFASQSSNNSSVYNTVQTNSGSWNYQGTDIKSLTSNWENTYTNFSLQSSNNISVYNSFNANSGNYNSTYNTVQTYSAAWIVDSTVDVGVRALTSNWENTYNTVRDNSATNWNYQGTDIKSLTSNWENTYNQFSTQSGNNLSVYNTVNSNSATTWNYQGTDIKTLTSNWENTYNNFSVQSSNNISVYNNVNSNSGNWNYAYHTILTGGTIGGNVSVSGNLSAWNADVNYVDFNSTVNNPPYQEGRLFYDNNDNTLALYVDNPDVTLNIGQEMWVLGVNKTGSVIPDGTVVYLSGAQGNRPKIWPALANNELRSADTIGVVTHSIDINQEGYVTTEGIISNIDTSNFREGEVLYLSPTIPGGITDVKPVAPQHLVKIGYALNATNNGKIFVTIDNGYEIDELHNVRITNIQNNQILTYNSTSSIWINTSAYDGTDIKSLTSNWDSVYNTFNSQSSNNQSVYNTVNINSASWVNDAPQTLSFNSINAELTISSGNTVSLSALSGGSSGPENDPIFTAWAQSYSANYQSTFNTVETFSATQWNYQGTDIKSLTSNWENTYNNFSVQSGNNLSVYTQVNSNSSNWSYPVVNVYTTNSTWTNPSPDVSRPVIIRLVGGGGGGGSGKSQTDATTKAGGGGGGGGGYVIFHTTTTQLSSTENIIVGAGGTGGAARIGVGNGNNGSNGNPTTMTLSGYTVRAVGGNDGVGGTTTGAAGAAIANATVVLNSVANTLAGGAGSTGAAHAAAVAAGTYQVPSGGGGGGGVNTANSVVYNAAAGGGWFTSTTLLAYTGAAVGVGQGASGSPGMSNLGVGSGGAGGNSSNTLGVAGGNGGNGGFPGGGGGGGGAYGNASAGDSGAGGNGGDGLAVIIVY